MHILPSTYCFLWSKWHRLFNGFRPPTFFSSTLEHVIMQLLRCLSLHITAQVLAKPSFQHSTDAIFPLGNINISMFTAIVHHICLHCSSLCFFVWFFSPSVCLSFPMLWITSLWFYLIFIHLSCNLLSCSCTAAYFLAGFPACFFLSLEPCFGMDQEAVFKLATSEHSLSVLWEVLSCSDYLESVYKGKIRTQTSWTMSNLLVQQKWKLAIPVVYG